MMFQYGQGVYKSNDSIIIISLNRRSNYCIALNSSRGRLLISRAILQENILSIFENTNIFENQIVLV